jgi:hypothetical protein
MDFVRITRGKQRYEISIQHIKGVSMTRAKKFFPNIPEDIVEKAHIAVNGKPKKKKSND